MAIKNAREMALLPYTSRVTTQRGGRKGRDDDRGDRGDRRPRRDGPREFEKLDGGDRDSGPPSSSGAPESPAPEAPAPAEESGAVATAEESE